MFNDEAAVEAAFRALRRELGSMVERGREGDAWRKKVFDAREHVEFRAVETRPGHDKPIFHRGAAGMSGGEGQEPDCVPAGRGAAVSACGGAC